MRALGLAAALAWLAVPSIAQACSVVPDYIVPSNYQLVRKADLIVLARVERGPTAEALGKQFAATQDSPPPQVVLTPVRVLKGTLPAIPLVVEGYVGLEGKPFVQHPTSLTSAHPSSYAGACIRQEYAVGALVVAIFQKQLDGSFRQEGSPFARSIEDVEGERGVWVRAVEHYVAIGALPTGAAREAALKADAARLLALNDDAGAPAIAADMLEEVDRHFPDTL